MKDAADMHSQGNTDLDSAACHRVWLQREFFNANLLVRNHFIKMILLDRPCAMGVSLFHVASYLPS